MFSTIMFERVPLRKLVKDRLLTTKRRYSKVSIELNYLIKFHWRSAEDSVYTQKVEEHVETLTKGNVNER